MNILSDGLKPPASSLKYLPQLDSVRALAVLLVLWTHWLPTWHTPGSRGVWIFFVLSGFLITRILLKSRCETKAENGHALYTFYVRRFLRIFPLYYFVLFLAFFGSALFRADWPWYVTYLQNFKIIMAGKTPVFGTHLWSLAVEEQFYVFWPLIALFAPRAVLLPVISTAIVVAVGIRFVLYNLGWSEFQIFIFTPSNLDTLGFGALLAYFATYQKQQVVSLRRIALIGAFVALGIEAFVRAAWGRASSTWLLPLPMGLFSVWMVSAAADGVRGLAGRIMSLPPLIYIGRISYGIYVYHFFVPEALAPLLERFHLTGDGVALVAVRFVIYFGVTMIVASLSWFLMEKPINSLKDRFADSSAPAKPKRSIGTAEAGMEAEG